MKRVALVFLALVMLLGCQVPGMAQEQYTITYWHHDADTLIVSALKKVIADFEAENPNIKIELTAWPADSYYQKYVTAVATNTAPDLLGVRDTEMLALVGMNALVPLNGYIDQWEAKDEIPQSIWDSINLYSQEGNTYMIPSYMNLCCVWYNQKTLSEAGIQPPKTQEEFLAYCQQMADPQNGKYFYTLRGGAGCYDNLFTYVMTYAGGNGFFDEAGNCVLSGEEYIKGLEEYASIYQNGWCSRDSITNAAKQMMTEFGAGTAAMLQHNSTSITTLRTYLSDEDIINSAPVVGKSGKAAQPSPNIIGAAMTTNCKNPDVAVKFLEYLAEHKGASSFCENAGKTPINNLVFEDEWCKNDPFLATYTDMLNDENIVFYQNPIWLDSWTTLINNDIVNEFQAVLMGDKSAADAMNHWAQVLQESQKAYLAAN